MKKLLLVFILLFSVFIITGCGKEESIVGNYKIIEIVEGDTTLDEKGIKDNNIDYTLEVKEDKTAVLSVIEKEKLKYDDKYFYSTEDKTDKISYTKDGKKIILKIDEIKLTFEKK